jgi:hypothetical protein
MYEDDNQDKGPMLRPQCLCDSGQFSSKILAIVLKTSVTIILYS